MRRYLSLLRIFWGNALSTELEYRAAFLANAFLSLFWLAWAALGVRAYFRFAESVRGWTYDELLVVMGLFFAINGLRQAIIQPNLSRMAEYIRLGTLDFLLTKPISKPVHGQLPARWDLQLARSDPGIGVGRLRPDPSGSARLGASHIGVCGSRPRRVAVMYAMALAVQCLAIWSIGAEGLDDVIQGVVEAARFPVDVYRGHRAGCTYVRHPGGGPHDVPADALLGRSSLGLIAIAVGVAAALLWITSRFWIWSLRHYAGASA